jgi:hypothetical protein
MALADVIADIELSYRQLEFSIRMLTYCEMGHLNPEEFDDDHVIALPEGSLHFPAGNFGDSASINRSAVIGTLLSVAAMALALDRGFEEIGLARNPAANDSNGKLRLLIYMVRCAFAHDIASPVWEVRAPFRRQLTIDFDPTPLTIDLAALDGIPFVIDQIGGYFNWDRIYHAVMQILNS